ncbi:MAG: helix-turn-helix domain-containing protein [Candidatus Acidoferrales bacterium]
MTQAEYKTLLQKLDAIIRLLAASILQGRKQRDQLKVLSAAGLTPKEIANLLGTTPNTVSVELYKMRKEGIL